MSHPRVVSLSTHEGMKLKMSFEDVRMTTSQQMPHKKVEMISPLQDSDASWENPRQGFLTETKSEITSIHRAHLDSYDSLKIDSQSTTKNIDPTIWNRFWIPVVIFLSIFVSHLFSAGLGPHMTRRVDPQGDQEIWVRLVPSNFLTSIFPFPGLRAEPLRSSVNVVVAIKRPFVSWKDWLWCMMMLWLLGT